GPYLVRLRNRLVVARASGRYDRRRQLSGRGQVVDYLRTQILLCNFGLRPRVPSASVLTISFVHMAENGSPAMGVAIRSRGNPPAATTTSGAGRSLAPATPATLAAPRTTTAATRNRMNLLRNAPPVSPRSI